MIERLFREVDRLGYKGRMVSLARSFCEVEQEIKGSYRNGCFNEEFYEEWLSWLVFSPPDTLVQAQSVIILAFPDPVVRVLFNWKGEKTPLVIPPTYSNHKQKDEQVENLLGRILGRDSYGVAKASLPEKLLAVRSGLGFYGKKNICYVDGMGSFHQLAAFYTELPAGEDSWQGSQLMKRCESCSACLQRCPTDAITPERFILHAERCLTFHNERTADFPEWIDPKWHNSLVGCLECQAVCPGNKDCLGWVEEKEEFSEEETGILLEGGEPDKLRCKSHRLGNLVATAITVLVSGKKCFWGLCPVGELG